MMVEGDLRSSRGMGGMGSELAAFEPGAGEGRESARGCRVEQNSASGLVPRGQVSDAFFQLSDPLSRPRFESS